MDQKFDPNVTDYTGSVANGVASFNMTPSLVEEGATVTINGQDVPVGTASSDIPLEVGENVITMVVTSADGLTERTYTYTITRAADVADLTAISLSSGTLSPVFAANTTTYSASVAGNVSSVDIIATAAFDTATFMVDGSAALSGAASTVNLISGDNVIDVVVTAEDGVTTKTYSITITRQSSNADLASLNVSTGTLSPAFSSNVTAYGVSLPFSVDSLAVTPVLSDTAGASLTVNGSALSSGASSSAIAMNVGINTIDIVATAEDGTTKSYTVTVTRTAPSANNDLSALGLSVGTLSPAFAAGTTSYTASVTNTTTSVDITASVADSASSLSIASTAASSGVASTVALIVGNNIIDVVVTAQDSTQKTYTVVVNRAAASSNADLSALGISAGSLSPAFASGTINYTANVTKETATIDITATLSDSTAGLTIAGTAATSGVAKTVNLNTGSNPIAIVVTADNGSQKTYTVDVTRAAFSTNADLSALSLSAGTLSPAFDTATLSYTASVAYAVTSVDFTATLSDTNASFTIGGGAATTGVAKTVNLTVGSNSIDILVTAEDSTTQKTYTVDITRAAASTDASLSALSLSSGTLSPTFDAVTYSYGATVTNDVTSITFTATANDLKYNALTVNGVAESSGVASAAVNLAVGDNSIDVVVTAEDGTTQATYTVVVHRNKDTSLSNIVPSEGALDQTFQSGSLNYTMTVPYLVSTIQFTSTLSDGTASMTVEGSAVGDGVASQAIALTAGATTTVNIIVTATDTSSTEYVVDVTRQTLASIAQNAFVKSANSEAGLLLGYSVDISGNTMVVSTPYEDSAATGIDGNPADDCGTSFPVNCAADSGAAYVYVRSGGVWSQQAYIKAPDASAGEHFGMSVAIDGDTLVIGAMDEGSAVTGVVNASGFPAAWDGIGAGGSGAAYVYVRSGSTWSLQSWLKASNTEAADNFGISVAISGDWIAVGSSNESSASVSTPADNSVPSAGAVYMYQRTGSDWAFTQYLKHSNPSTGTGSAPTWQADKFGLSLALDGTTLAVGAPFDDSGANTIDGNAADDCTGAATNCSGDSGSVFIFAESGGTWTQQAYIRSNFPGGFDQFGHDIDLLGDTLVVGAPREGSGLADTPSDNTIFGSGAVYVLTRSVSTWSHQGYLKAGYIKLNGQFGQQVALGNGYLVVGVPLDDSANVGGSDVDDCGAGNTNCATNSGGAYLFTGSGATWTQQKYIKASNVANGDSTEDNFGGNAPAGATETSTMATDGGIIVFGVRYEDDSGTGITTPSDDGAADSGAVYIFQ